MNATVRVLVVGEPGDVLPGLDAMPTTGPSLQVIGPVRSTHATEAVLAERPDLVVVREDHARVPSVLGAIRRASGRVRILVQAHVDPRLIPAVLSAGGCGVLPADLDPSAMREALLRAHAGELILGDDELGMVVRTLSVTRAWRSSTSLTARELEVLRAVAEGTPTADVARSLGISPATVQAHLKNVMGKLQVHSKVEAVRVAWRQGLVAVPA